MARKHDRHHKQQEEKEASFLLQAGSLAGLVGYAVYCVNQSRSPDAYVIVALSAIIIGTGGVERIINAIGRVIGRR